MADTVIKLGPESLRLIQSVAVAEAMLGHTPFDPENAVFDNARDTLTYPQNPADGEGLFAFDEFAPTPGPKHVYIASVRIRCGATVTWEIFLTDGLEGGADGTTEDAPNQDISLISGTGPAILRINRELMPQEKLRVVTAVAATIPTVVEVLATTVLNEGGRLIS